MNKNKANNKKMNPVNFIRTRNKVNLLIKDHIIRLLGIPPDQVTLTLNLGTIACLYLLVEREEYITHFDTTEKRYNGNTLISKLNKMGVPIDDIIIDTFHELVLHGFIESDAQYSYSPGENAVALSKFFNNMLRDVTSVDLVSYLTKLIERVVIGQVDLERALAKIDSLFLNRGRKRASLKFSANEHKLIETSLTEVQEVKDAQRIIDDFRDHCENDPIDAFEYSQSKDIIEALLERMRSKKDFPSFYQTFIEVNQALDSDYASASEVANVVLKDYSLTNKLLKLVNSSFYGNFRQRVSTVSQAVILLGLNQVKLAAAGLIFFEQMNNTSYTVELKDACIRSFMSGLIAREIAILWNVREVEQASICAMFHSLGEYIVLFYLPEEYHEIKKREKEKKVDIQIASRTVLGMTFEDLGMSFASYWGLPKEIISTMRRIPHNVTELSNISILRIIAYISNVLCDITGIDRRSDREKQFEKIEKKFELSQIDIYKIYYAVWHKLTKYSSILNIDLGGSKLLTKFSVNIINKEVEVFEPDEIEIIDIKTDFDSMVVSGVGNITGVILEDGFELNQVLSLILEIMFQGFSFSHVLICVLNKNSNTMEARYGLGKGIENIMEHFVFKISDAPDILNKAIRNNEDIHIMDVHSFPEKHTIPSWYRKLLRVESVFIYPIVINKNAIGFFYADWEKRRGDITEKHINYMNILRNQAALAIKQKR